MGGKPTWSEFFIWEMVRPVILVLGPSKSSLLGNGSTYVVNYGTGPNFGMWHIGIGPSVQLHIVLGPTINLYFIPGPTGDI